MLSVIFQFLILDNKSCALIPSLVLIIVASKLIIFAFVVCNHAQSLSDNKLA
jgi:hypothetical protein